MKLKRKGINWEALNKVLLDIEESCSKCGGGKPWEHFQDPEEPNEAENPGTKTVDGLTPTV